MHDLTGAIKKPCPTCGSECVQVFRRTGVTANRVHVGWYEFMCKTCRIRWVVVGRLGVEEIIE